MDELVSPYGGILNIITSNSIDSIYLLGLRGQIYETRWNNFDKVKY